MSRTLAYQRAMDGRATAGTGLVGLLVSFEVVLEFPAAVNPIDAGPVAADALAQDFANGAQ
jgi:hypothetical protein